MAGVLSGHLRQTHDRIRERPSIRIVHDTTTFRFLGDREGLGMTRGGAKGFLAHIALALGADDMREPLGVLNVHSSIHQDAVTHRGMTPSQRVLATRTKPRAAKESARWEQTALQVSAALPAGVVALHVMDQEADDDDVLAVLHDAQLRYVIRADPQRQTTDAPRTVTEVLAQPQPATVFRTVRLTPRSERKAERTRGRHPARDERNATLQIRWGAITVPRRQYTESRTPTLPVWAVHVREPHPPRGQAPIEWMLFTSEPLQTLEDATALVDHSRARWVIEDDFKALKTGCAFEKRQLTTFDGLVRALALFIPMAWRLLVLRHLGRADSLLPVGRYFTAEQLRLLRKLLRRRGYQLLPTPSIRDVMLGIAALGGHIPHNGPPGWLVLGRGLTRLLDAAIGWTLAREM